MSKSKIPNVWLRRCRNERAKKFGRYPSRLATFQIRSRVGKGKREAAGPLLITSDAVVMETPLSFATSPSVTFVLAPLCSVCIFLIPLPRPSALCFVKHRDPVRNVLLTTENREAWYVSR